MNIFNKKSIFLTVLCGLFALQASMVKATEAPKKPSKKIAKIACVFTVGSLLAAAAWYKKEYLGTLITHFIGKDIVSHEQKDVASREKQAALSNSNQSSDMTEEDSVAKDQKKPAILDSLPSKDSNSLETLEATLIAFAKSLAHKVNEQLNSVCSEE